MIIDDEKDTLNLDGDGGQETPEPVKNDAAPTSEKEATGAASTRDDKPLTIRESIAKAFEDQKSTDGGRERDEKGRFAPKSKEEVQDGDKLPDKELSDPIQNNDRQTPQKEAQKPVDDGVSPPTSWSTEAKSDFNKLPASVRQAVAKREKEVSDGFAQYKAIKDKYDSFEHVIAPRRQQIQQFGVSEAETVDRLFKWMEALTGPNKLSAYQELGRSFGITNGQQPQPNGADNSGEATDDLPPELKRIVDTFTSATSEIDKIKAQMQAQQEAEARARQTATQNFLTDWSKDKTHFQTVRQAMHGLITSGAIATETGPDGKPAITSKVLDAAYEHACYANPTVRAELLQKSEADRIAKEKKAQQEAERKRHAQQAAARAVSIKPSAPTNGVARSKAPQSNKSVSVRDSINKALREATN
jgi:hypothetical protein